MKAGGNGVYYVADLYCNSGKNTCGGWSIAVVYSNSALPARNLSVFNGFKAVCSSGTFTGGVGTQTVAIPLSGFATPKYGAVNAKVGVMGYEGDAGITGDQLLFNSSPMSDAQHSASNYWCSIISRSGSLVTTRSPSWTNNLGFDCSIVALANTNNAVLGNDATSATVSFYTNGDTYYPAMLTTAIDLYTPVIAAVKTTLDINGENVTPGDILEYTIGIKNTAGDDAINCVLTDPLPEQVSYVPGSIKIVNGPNAGDKTDAAGDDQAEFISGSNTLVIRLGNGATSGTGGTLLLGGSTTISFKVQVRSDIANGVQIKNQAQMDYNSMAHPEISITTASTVATVNNSKTIQGTVFEDVNYTGGAGRGPLTSGGASAIPPAPISYPTGAVGRNGVRVELYDAWGNFVKAVTTGTSVNAYGVANGDGVYDFTDVAPGDYAVRVVSNTVTSSRGGSNLVPVQTYRTEGAAGTVAVISGSSVKISGLVNPVTDRVGGENPALADAGPNLTNANLSTLITGSTTAQSITRLSIGVNDVLQADFGYNFDTIVNTNPGGQGSLDQFIKNANGLTGTDTAIFMIPNGSGSPGLNSSYNLFNGGGYASIAQTGTLTAATAPVIIDATTQPGWTGAAPVVEINGSGSGGAGLVITGGGSTIKGLAINRFTGAGLTLSGVGNNVITGNVIGADPSGGTALPNGTGIVISVSGNTIGGTAPAARNLVSGNTGAGIRLSGASATTNLIQGNYVGTTADGAGALGNGGSGILAENGAKTNTIGGSAAAANTVAHNGAGGVVVTGAASTGNTIQRNSIFANTGPGIDLGANGVTPNPNTGLPGGGANNGMDYPVFKTAVLVGSTLTVTGYVGSAEGQAAFANTTLEIFLADDSPADQNGQVIAGIGGSVPHGEGRTYLGTLTTGANGTFSATFNLPSLHSGDSITATATLSGNTSEFSPNAVVLGPGVTITGFVYNDANTNSQKETSENGTGLTLYAKLLGSGTGPALASAAVDSVTGAYSFSNVAAGTYSIVINGTNDLTVVTPAYPQGWVGTEFATGQRSNVVVANQNQSAPYNFGLTYAVTLSGIVFKDTGAGGGTANDGVLNGGETGLAGSQIRVTDSSGALVYGSATPGADGAFTVYLSSTIPNGTSLKVTETNPAGHLSTGASAGNTAGAYTRASDTLAFAFTQGTSYSGIQFGDVPEPTLDTEGQQTGLPGTVVFYPHTFQAGSAGSVVFSVTNQPNPAAVTGWAETVFNDLNGNGKFDTGEPLITGPVDVVAGQTLKLLVKEYIPTSAPYNALNRSTLSAGFSYTGANPPLSGTLSRADTTVVGENGAGLVLLKQVDKEAARPGEPLTYTIVYTNNSPEPLSNVVIYDSTPAFTTFVSSTWSTPLPASLTAVTPVAPAVGEKGAIRWTFTGQLQPAVTGTVSFQVMVVP